MTITLTGTNDAPVISGTTTGSVTEAGGGLQMHAYWKTRLVATGTLTDTDVDNTANTFQPVLTAATSDSHFGSYTVDASGHWSWLHGSTTTTPRSRGSTSTRARPTPSRC